MITKLLIASSILMASVVAVPVVSLDKKKKEDPIVALKKKYKFTDKVVNCISTRRLDSTHAVDNKNILFVMRGKKNKYLLNEMKYNCPRLKFEDRFKYTLRGSSQLCSIDIITVIDSFMNSYGSCGLGKFRILEKIETKKDAK